MSSEVKVKVSLVSGAIQSGLTKVKAQFSQLRNDLQHSLGSFLAFGGIVHGLDSMIKKATDISNISRRFGAPARELQRVANAGRENGAEMEDVARSWNKLAVNQQKAIHGNEEMRAAFTSLGIPMAEVAKMTIDELFYRVADATASAKDRGKAYADVVKLMGRNAGLLYTTLEMGAGKIKAQGDEMGIMSDNAIEQLHKMHVAIEVLKNNIFVYGGAILVFFQKVLESIGAFVGETVNEIELMVNVFRQAGLVTTKFAKGLFKGKIDLDTSGLVNAVKDVQKNAGAIGKILSGIWKVEPAKMEGGPKPPIDRELEPTGTETARAEKLITLREQLAEIERKSANDQLTIQGKINALIAQRAALLKEAVGTKDEEKKLQLEIDAAKVNDEITAAVKERTRYIEQGARETEREEEERKKQEGGRIAATSLRRIGGQTKGGFAVGGMDDKLLREQTRHGKLLEKIVKNTEGGNGELQMR